MCSWLVGAAIVRGREFNDNDRRADPSAKFNGFDAVFKAEGFNEADAEAVLVLINDAQSDQQAALADGDRLEFMVSIQGG